MTSSGRVGVRAVGGGFVLFVGRLAYNAVSAVGSIVIARLLGPANYGYTSIGNFRRAFTAL